MTTTQGLGLARDLAERHGQGHLVAGWDSLGEDARTALAEDILAIDWPVVAPWLGEEGAARRSQAARGDRAELEPAVALQPDDGQRRAARAAGEAVLRRGRVAALTVAGGQGTRLGWSGPKGTFPGTPITGKPLFRVFAEQIRRARDRYGVPIRWLIMTSPENDAATRAFLTDNNCFGLPRRDIAIFPQGVHPSIDLASGRILMADRHAIAFNPDGHGGVLRALESSGVLDGMIGLGVEILSSFQIDNPLVRALDPVFIGLHLDAAHSSGEMSSKAVIKSQPEERVGVFARCDGRLRVVEYMDLPEAVAARRDADGGLAFRWGSIAVHLLGTAFVRKLVDPDSGATLPLHGAMRKMPYFDPAIGRRVEPAEPNAIKLETFLFDAIPFAEKSLVLATERREEFAPIKNARGEDSAATSYRMQMERACAWLESAGVRVPRRADGSVDAEIEISPLSASGPEDLEALAALPGEIRPGQRLVI